MMSIFLLLPFVSFASNLAFVMAKRPVFLGEVEGVKVYLLPRSSGGFTFLSRVFLGSGLSSLPRDALLGVLYHEVGHAKRFHSFLSGGCVFVLSLAGAFLGLYYALLFSVAFVLFTWFLEIDADLFAVRRVGVKPVRAYLLSRGGDDVFHPPRRLRLWIIERLGGGSCEG